MILLDQGGRARPWTEIRRPGPRASRYYESLWLQTLPQSVAAEGWRIVPDASAHILVKRMVGRGGRPSETVISLIGPRSVFVDTDRTGRRYTLGARLRPGAAGALFGVSGAELRDRSLALEDVAPSAAAGLRAALSGSGTAREALEGLASWCAGLARRADEIEPRALAFCRMVQACGGRREIGNMACELGLSARRLRAVSGQEIGLGPKRVARIARAYEALRRGGRCRHSWSRVALESGYCDEAHMIRDFRDLFSATPRRFLARGDDRFLQSSRRRTR